MQFNKNSPLVVVAAVIFDSSDSVLLSQRKLGKRYAGMWEFPGGKVEHGETIHQALARELWEELDIVVNIETNTAPYMSVEHEGFLLHIFLCHEFQGVPVAKEQQKLQVFKILELQNLRMPPADIAIIRKLIEEFV
ncbi:(deoxy)nucleoside triphosphate pyrophosphohydrolase [Bartonella sp. TP]|uniref:(deoxy)nucleoside triphosphate pyrophosphohydrolase n=1 Tax=Bartonella sp. TP TaxID=3057550 RepID=UPI0025B24DA2|nr:(deoxy)nucleoside triphosphate pyrophosphohydrolase [Bartonella sp. TP]MDN5248708.1 (deoxy)nucleoside triphosphate pyrophosphohydrolase [Alphaproteobacteria bacterium]WJW79615.1 (deoxy)nucleoside triphosphate pyrophosphohydrolase [Bartonella sp. TP]